MMSVTSPTALFLSHPNFCGLLRGANSTAERMNIVRIARAHATMVLASAIERVPVEKPSIVAAYRARGMEPTWMLNGYDDIARFRVMLRDYTPTPGELEASALLMACVCAEELGDVPEFSNMQLAIETRENQRIKGIARGEQLRREKTEKDSVECIHGRGNVSSIVVELACMEDSLGDYLSPKDDLWPQLFGRLDELGLKPSEVLDDRGNPLRIEYLDGDGKAGQITFGSFKTMVSNARTARKVK